MPSAGAWTAQPSESARTHVIAGAVELYVAGELETGLKPGQGIHFC
jgi:hypothetical protein